MQTSDTLLCELDDDGVLPLTMNDTGRRDALSEAMLGQLFVSTEPSEEIEDYACLRASVRD